MRKVELPVTAFELEDERDGLSGISASTGASTPSSSSIVSLLICLRLLIDFVRDFWEVDEDATPTLCFLGTGLGSSSAGLCLVLCRFRFPREGSPDAREPLSDLREITGELVARVLAITEFRELLEFLTVCFLGVDAVNARGFFCFFGPDATVSVCPSAERN